MTDTPLWPHDADEGAPKSQQALAYERISQKIVLAQYQPGQKITLSMLEEQLGMGRTPIREALVRLQDDGLVQAVPQSGTYVSKIDLKLAECGRYTREILETQVAAECCAKATKNDVRHLKENLAVGERQATQGDALAFFQSDNEFHRELYAIAGRLRMYRWLQELCVPLNRYRLLRALTESLDSNDITGDHEEIVSAIERRDVHAVSFLVTRHVRMMSLDKHDVVQRFPHYFVDVEE